MCDDPSIEVVALTESAGAAAGALVAARHARERERFALLPPGYEDPSTAAELVRRTLSFCSGVGSLDDVGRVYAALFRELAGHALAKGITDHVVHVPIGDAAIEAAWVALGFGRSSAVAVRDLAPVDRPVTSDVQIRLATPEEVDVVEQLVDEEAVFHAGSPIFRPYVRDATSAAVRAELTSSLASSDRAILVARRDGRDVGVLSIEPGLGSPLYIPDGAAYIGATAVLPDERGSGTGARLLDAALAWASDHGHSAACLHFSTANSTSMSFWTGVGFTPVMVHMRRRLDERILTNRPTN